MTYYYRLYVYDESKSRGLLYVSPRWYKFSGLIAETYPHKHESISSIMQINKVDANEKFGICSYMYHAQTDGNDYALIQFESEEACSFFLLKYL